MMGLNWQFGLFCGNIDGFVFRSPERHRDEVASKQLGSVGAKASIIWRHYQAHGLTNLRLHKKEPINGKRDDLLKGAS